jgi:hypothetical protein
MEELGVNLRPLRLRRLLPGERVRGLVVAVGGLLVTVRRWLVAVERVVLLVDRDVAVEGRVVVVLGSTLSNFFSASLTI